VLLALILVHIIHIQMYVKKERSQVKKYRNESFLSIPCYYFFIPFSPAVNGKRDDNEVKLQHQNFTEVIMKVIVKKTVVAALVALLVTGTVAAQSAPAPKAVDRGTVTLVHGQRRGFGPQQGFGPQWGDTKPQRNNNGPRRAPAPWAGKEPRTPPAEQTLQGTLTLKDGMLALRGDAAIYYMPGIRRFVGFIDGLKDGARVTVKGYVINTDHGDILHPYELNLSGKTYEVGRKWVEPAAPAKN
jgi:hypothetical protein